MLAGVQDLDVGHVDAGGAGELSVDDLDSVEGLGGAQHVPAVRARCGGVGRDRGSGEPRESRQSRARADAVELEDRGNLAGARRRVGGAHGAGDGIMQHDGLGTHAARRRTDAVDLGHGDLRCAIDLFEQASCVAHQRGNLERLHIGGRRRELLGRMEGERADRAFADVKEPLHRAQCALGVPPGTEVGADHAVPEGVGQRVGHHTGQAVEGGLGAQLVEDNRAAALERQVDRGDLEPGAGELGVVLEDDSPVSVSTSAPTVRSQSLTSACAKSGLNAGPGGCAILGGSAWARSRAHAGSPRVPPRGRTPATGVPASAASGCHRARPRPTVVRSSAARSADFGQRQPPGLAQRAQPAPELDEYLSVGCHMMLIYIKTA